MNEIDELLDGALRAFKDGKEKLATARERLEETVDFTKAQISDPAALLHSAISCVLVDSLEPALRDLGNLDSRGVFPATIRPATPDDFEAIQALLAESPELGGRLAAVPEDIELAIREPGGVFLVAEDSGSFAGFIYAVQETTIAATIRHVAVIPKLRRLGIASRLLTHCLAVLAHDRDIKEVGAFVRPNSTAWGILDLNQFHTGDSCLWMSRDVSALADSEAPEESEPA